MLDSEETAPKLDDRKHAVINTELKNLYVGITRARHRELTLIDPLHWLIRGSMKSFRLLDMGLQSAG